MACRNVLRGQFSLKNVRLTDVLSRAASLRRTGKGLGLGLGVSRAWLWSEKTSRLLQRRLAKTLEAAGDYGSFLQIGTFIEIDRRFGEYATFSDMTIPQAYAAGQFSIAKLTRRQYHEAVAVQRRVVQCAAHIFTLSEWARQSMIHDLGVNPQRVTTIYGGPNVIIPIHADIPRKPHQILYVGIDWKRKGGPQLVEGFRLFRQSVPDAELVIVGCSPKIRCPGVRVEGYLHPNDPAAQKRLSRIYSESSIFAMMSKFEPLGIAFIEAFAMGLPVVAYQNGSRAEIVHEGQSGLLCADRDPKTIADAFHKLLDNPGQRIAMGAYAQNLVRTEFNWNSAVSRIIEKFGPQPKRANTKQLLAV
jgi:glycosyltransferase involved in cell wall biosynthesis